jgi:hypothetical protein
MRYMYMRGGAAMLVVLSAGFAAAFLVLREPAIRTWEGDGAGPAIPRRQTQGAPPAPVPVPGTVPATGARCFNAVPGSHILHDPPAPGSCRPFVAVVAPCTSRGKKYKNVAGTPYVEKFFKTVLQTLVKSDETGYDVAFYVGYDAGDEIWDTEATRRDLPGLLQGLVDRYYKKSLLEEVRAMDFNANKHMPGLSIKTVSAWHAC